MTINSTGGSSDYYKITLLSSVEKEEVSFELDDYLRDGLDNQWDLCNISKACRRIAENRKGSGKQGTSEAYDLNKIIWFATQRLNYIAQKESID